MPAPGSSPLAKRAILAIVLIGCGYLAMTGGCGVGPCAPTGGPTGQSPLISIDAKPDSISLDQKGATEQLVVSGIRLDMTTFELTADPQVVYASNNESAVTVSSEGLVTAVGSGTAIVTVAYAELKDEVPVEVKIDGPPSPDRCDFKLLTVVPGAITFSQSGETKQLEVLGICPDESIRDLTPAATGTSYASSQSAVALVSDGGLITAVSNGAATITVRNGNLEATVQVIVDIKSPPPPPPPATLVVIAVSPGSPIFLRTPGETRQLSVLGTFSDGSVRDITAASTGTMYQSSNPAVAIISPDGLLAAADNGETDITVSNAGLTAPSIVVKVDLPPVLVGLALLPDEPIAFTNSRQSQTLQVIGLYSDNSQRDLTTDPATTYESSAESVALVSPLGVVRPGASGGAIITARHNGFADTVPVSVDVLTTITATSPYSGEAEVNVFRESVIDFLNPVAMVPPDAISAFAASQFVPTRTVLSTNRKRLWLFYDQALPGNTEIAVRIDGGRIIDDAGRLVDADSDDAPGGEYAFSYQTLSLTPILGTRVMGRIFDSELLPERMNTPLEGVRISVEGLPSVFAVTDNMGNYTLENTPAGTFFVHIDGAQEVTSQGIDGPLAYYYPTLGKPFPGVKAGQDNVMPDIFLPKVMKADLQRNIDVSQEITITSSDPRLAGIEITVPPNSLFRDDGQPVTFVGVGAVPPDRLPGPLPPGVNPPVVFTFQTDATNLMAPAAVRFPNLEDLPPASKSGLFSFNHDTGRFQVAGSMSVDPAGQYLHTDSTAGIPAPGWHFTQPGGQGEGGGGGCQSGDPCCFFGFPAGAVGRCAAAVVQCIWVEVATVLSCSACATAPYLGFPCVSCVWQITGGKYFCIKSIQSCVDCAQSSRLASVGPDINSTLVEAIDVLSRAQPHLDEIRARLLLAQANNELTIADVEFVRERFAMVDAESGGSFIGFANRVTSTLTNADLLSGTFPSRPDHMLFYAVNYSDRAPLRGMTGLDGTFTFQLQATDTPVVVNIFDPVNWSLGTTTSVDGIASGQLARLLDYELVPITVGDDDQDLDGLPDLAEFVVGTSFTNADTDADGQLDGSELRAGTDPLGGGLAQTGIIAAIDTPGFAHEVCVKDDRAIVADGPDGISVFNVFQATQPVLVARVDTPGTAVDVDCEGNFIAVADAAAGLAVVDISTPNAATVVRQVALPGSAQARCAAVVLGVAYVGDNQGRVHLIELSSGALLGSLTLNAAHSVDDLGVSNQSLFALTTANSGTGGTLYALSLTPGLPSIAGQIAASHSSERTGPFPRRRMSVGLNRVLVNEFGGVQAFNTANPAAMSQICLDILLAAVKGVAENGSGEMVLAGGAAGNAECQVYGNFPPSCSTFQTLYPTPGDAHGVGINNGLAYFADGSAGLQIVNILSADVQGVPPTGMLSISAIPSGDVTEGGRARILADVADDVQIRNVEFRVNGQQVNVDGNYPFEFYWPIPPGSAGTTVEFTATARDTGGNALEMGPLLLPIVEDTQPPTVAITAPANNAEFFRGDDLFVTVSANDNVRVTAISFQIDGQSVDPRRISQTEWQLPLPVTLGLHTLTATATDTAGLVNSSQAILFHVRAHSVSHELSVFVGKQPFQPSDAITREVGVFVSTPALGYGNAIARELSIFIGAGPSQLHDCTSREVSVDIAP